MRLEISREALDGVLAAAAASPDAEVCGLLLGEGMRVDLVIPCRNVSTDPANGFEIDPQVLIGAHKAARSDGPLVIGHYHSHPSGKAEPSARDAAAAQGGEVWLIVAHGEVMAWQALSAKRFSRLELPRFAGEGRGPVATGPILGPGLRRGGVY